VAGLPSPGLGRGAPVVWGVLNVTPDSFSDGGRFDTVDHAVEQARLLHRQGADIIDVGGESTRPGAERISPDTEMQRVLPVIQALVSEGMTVSIDTMRAQVAQAAVHHGASIVNDVSGGRADTDMHRSVAELGVPYVLMHWRGHSVHMNELASYQDTVGEVCREISEQVTAATNAGVSRDMIVVDPGIGFAKEAQHNWELLTALEKVAELDLPILVGASRKRFLGSLLEDPSGQSRPSEGRDVATAVLSGLLTLSGVVWGLRVHDVQGTVDAIKVVAAMSGDAK
jgi:dihydropteroate synthase